MENPRRLPVGAEIIRSGGAHFRVWAPKRKKAEVVLDGGRAFDLDRESSGYFSGQVADAHAGTLYHLRLDGGGLLQDPASRFQPQGPHGPSQIIDPASFQWTDTQWKGLSPDQLVIYEMHIGTFTREGTFAAAERELPELAATGITMLEIMPLAEFPGRYGWGYDGVDLFAPTHNYGTPDDLRRFIDKAHANGVAVILDVVYNHLGPDGNCLGEFSPDFFTDRYENEWGRAINFDGKNSGPVREFFCANAVYWIDEFHFDGLRLDATQQIFDNSNENIMAQISREARRAAGSRTIYIVGENEPQDIKLALPPEQRGYGLDALWNDDFHHSAMVAMTGRNEAYYTDYLGKAQEFISMAKYGFLYQGQRYKWQKKRRGTSSLHVRPTAFVTFIQNHDQVANSGRGLRCHALTAPGVFRAMTALLLLAPQTPMLFQGQEFAASTPFFYFADHKPELATQIRAGRAEFLRQFPSLATPEMQAQLRAPDATDTFESSKLDFSERKKHHAVYQLHRDLLRLRREDPVLSGREREGLDGAVLNNNAFVFRHFAHDGADRLIIVNFGTDLHLDPAPEPLLAPPAGHHWETLLSTEHPDYGGHGAASLDTEENWRISGYTTAVLAAASGTAA